MLSLANGFPSRSVKRMHWNKKSRKPLDIAKGNRFKRPFEFLLVADHHGREVLDVLGEGMKHHAQALLALSITSVLCLAAWIWARRRLMRFQTNVNRHDEM